MTGLDILADFLDVNESAVSHKHYVISEFNVYGPQPN